MDLAIVAVGRLKAGPEAELCGRFLDRAGKTGRGLGFRGFEVTEIAEGRAARAVDRVAAEEQQLLNLLARRGRTVCLDPGGELLTSEEMASMLGQAAATATPRTAFVIGGPDGMGAGVLQAADLCLSFGRLTWPHQIVRVLLAEQLYRAMTILSGHPYHRA